MAEILSGAAVAQKLDDELKGKIEKLKPNLRCVWLDSVKNRRICRTNEDF